jgi:hypothetical protein
VEKVNGTLAELMEMAGQREDFSDEEIDAFGTHCDDFFEL